MYIYKKNVFEKDMSKRQTNFPGLRNDTYIRDALGVFSKYLFLPMRISMFVFCSNFQ